MFFYPLILHIHTNWKNILSKLLSLAIHDLVKWHNPLPSMLFEKPRVSDSSLPIIYPNQSITASLPIPPPKRSEGLPIFSCPTLSIPRYFHFFLNSWAFQQTILLSFFPIQSKLSYYCRTNCRWNLKVKILYPYMAF